MSQILNQLLCHDEFIYKKLRQAHLTRTHQDYLEIHGSSNETERQKQESNLEE